MSDITYQDRLRKQAADFVKTWEEAASLQEVADTFGISRRRASARAAGYRTRYDLNLRHFPRGGHQTSISKIELQGLVHNHAPRKTRRKPKKK